MTDNYPRPQMRRESWQSLDGEWIINGSKGRVPSCRSEEHIIYEKQFEFHRENDRVLLHIGAADQIARVWLNGEYLGEHEGGYLHFTFEISKVVKEGSNELRIEITDTLDHTYPYGKQRRDRGGMWYTPVSGIWQSVWIEQVPGEYIKDIKIRPDLTGADIVMTIDAPEGDKKLTQRIEPEDPVLWTVEEPRLYYHTLTYGRDEVEIYYALRTIEIRNIRGINRVCLNGEPIFLNGVLDQGYFEEGLFIPSDTEEYDRDILRMKELGFILLRKHIKVEPDAFYYACDRLGMLVMQDMVNSGDYKFMRDTVLGTLGLKIDDRSRKGSSENPEDGWKTDKRRAFFVSHSMGIQDQLGNFPSVIAYTIFNEGWGQFDSDRIYELLKDRDPGRLYDSTSGWFHQQGSDFDSEHIYFRLKKLKPQTRPLFVSECGGYSLNLKSRSKTYGYGSCKDKKELTERICRLYEQMIIPGISGGVCGCIYTQLSDIEDEINGLWTYDRKECKVEPEGMGKVAEMIRLEMEKIAENG